MDNELVIKPLIEYELTFIEYGNDGPENRIDRFTAESYDVVTDPRSIRFMRTGNIVREYFVLPEKIVATPVVEGE